MTIEKTIEILTYHEPRLTYDENPHVTLAFHLGIEALLRHKNKASLTFSAMMAPLPGETDE